MKITEKIADVGVIIGRFQVAELHEGHIKLIDWVMGRHPKTIIVLGLSPCKSTFRNPLDFQTREMMLKEKFPELIVLYLKDCSSDVEWSHNLDTILKDVTGPIQTISLYGSRDSFIKYYCGPLECISCEQEVFISGANQRHKISQIVKASPDFRAGVIWAMANQYPRVISTVDIAIFNEDCSKILLGRKKDDAGYRFIGGHANPGESLEQAAKREAYEETGLGFTDSWTNIGSTPIDDWRWRQEIDKITTTLFTTKIMFGRPTPQDDIHELRWFEVKDLSKTEIVPEHLVLVNMINNWLGERSNV